MFAPTSSPESETRPDIPTGILDFCFFITHQYPGADLGLQDSTNGELFASVNYAHPWPQVEPVLDSSRYFVLRVDGEGGKRAYIGMGFAERGEAFDFQVSSAVLYRLRTEEEPLVTHDYY